MSRRRQKTGVEFDYQRYLASREWGLLREAVRLRAALGIPAWAATAYCERCRLYPLKATHHLTYERIGREDLDDLLGVCAGCHAYLSGKSEDDPVDEALAKQVEELAWATGNFRELARSKDWGGYAPMGCLGVAGGSVECIELLLRRREGIAKGRPASEFLQARTVLR